MATRIISLMDGSLYEIFHDLIWHYDAVGGRPPNSSPRSLALENESDQGYFRWLLDRPVKGHPIVGPSRQTSD